MSGHFARKYTDQQRNAVIEERARTGDTYGAIVARLAAGNLVYEGEPVPAIEMDSYYAGELCRQHARKMSGAKTSGLSAMAHGDAMESIRVRLLALTEHDMKKQERKAKAGKEVDPARIQALAKAAREISHLDPDAAPGTRKAPPGARKGSGTTSGGANGTTPSSGLAGEIMRDHKASAARAHETNEEE